MRVLLVLVLALGALTTPLAAQPPAVVTLDKMTEYLSLGVPEAKLLKLVTDSPAVFVLGQAEEEALRKAGATDALIDAIKAKAKATVQTGDIRAFVVILDVSGSMADKDTAGVAKWGPAQKAAIDLVAAVPEGRHLSFVVYGHDAKKECEAIEVVLPLSPITPELKGRLKEYILKLKPAGHTPIAASLKMAGGELKKAEGLSKVILITDGMETCHGDPNKEAAELAKIDTFRGVDVVALGLTAAESKAVGEIAKSGKGKYYDAKTTADLARSVATITAAIKKPEPVKPADPDPTKLSPLEQALVDQLTDKDWKVRKEACDGLAGRKCKAAAGAVADFLAGELYDTPPGDTRERSRDAAVEFLQAVAPDQTEAALTRALRSSKPEVKAWAGKAVAKLKK